MAKRDLSKAKLVIHVEGNKKAGTLKTVAVFDNRIQEYLPEAYIQERGIQDFLSMEHMKETLNWNLNGDSSKYHFAWGHTVNGVSQGRAYVFH